MRRTHPFEKSRDRDANRALLSAAVERKFMDRDNSSRLPQTDIERLNAYIPQKEWGLYFWGFTCFSREDYAGVVPLDGVDEIMLGVYCVHGGTLGELAICWHMLGGKPVPRLEAYNDAWQIIQAPTFLTALEHLTQMGRDHRLTPDEVSRLLIAHGFTDQSDRPLDENDE